VKFMNVNSGWKAVLLFDVYFLSPTFCRSHGKKRGFGGTKIGLCWNRHFSKLGLASKCCAREGGAGMQPGRVR